MTNVLIIGASGNVGSHVRQTLLAKTDAKLTLFCRSANKLQVNPEREKAIAGDAASVEDLKQAITNQDFIFAALSGNLPELAAAITQAMKFTGVKRIAFISSMGIYNEIPASVGSNGNLRVNGMLMPYRQAADIVENSGLTYTIIRPGWFTQGPVNYELTKKGEPFGTMMCLLASIADLVKKLVENPEFGQNESLGINTPNS